MKDERGAGVLNAGAKGATLSLVANPCHYELLMAPESQGPKNGESEKSARFLALLFFLFAVMDLIIGPRFQAILWLAAAAGIHPPPESLRDKPWVGPTQKVLLVICIAWFTYQTVIYLRPYIS